MSLSLVCCCKCEVVNADVRRYMILDSLLTAGFGEKDWQELSGNGGASGGGTDASDGTHWTALIETTDPYVTDPITGDLTFTLNFAPVRFTLSNFAGIWPISPARPWNNNYATTPNSVFETGGILEPGAETGFVGHAAVLPTSASHVSVNNTVSAMTLPLLIEPPFSWDAAYFSSLSVSITQYRIWVNSVDVTGWQATLAMPVMDLTGATIHVDLKVRVIATGTGPGTGFHAAKISPAGGLGAANFEYGNSSARRTCHRNWKVTFEDNGPGGLTELELIPQSGWTHTRTATRIYMINDDESIIIRLDWSREYATVWVFDETHAGDPSSSWANLMRYLPEDSGHYELNKLVNGAVVSPGVWNPAASTVFSLRQRQKAISGTPVNGWGTDGGGTSTPSTWPSNVFSPFPTSVSVVPI